MTSQEYKTARRELGLTQRQLAEVLGVTRATVNRRESAGGTVTTEAELAMAALAVRRLIDATEQGDPLEAVTKPDRKTTHHSRPSAV
jgi:DNA-binding XRE family transcriptional regulator